VKYHDRINRNQAEKLDKPKKEWAMLSLRFLKKYGTPIAKSLENKANSRSRARGKGSLTPNMG
jgi:hypothetical protein